MQIVNTHINSKECKILRIMEAVSQVVDVADKKRLLSTDDNQDDTNTVSYATVCNSYNRLPVGALMIERVGVLSRLDPVKKKKL